MKKRIGLALSLSLALGAGILLHAGEARADRWWEPMKQGSRIGLETDLWPADRDFLATMDLFAQIAVHPHVGLDIDIPWAIGNYQDRDRAIFGNPTFGVHYVGKLTTAFALHAGFSLTIPSRFHNPDLDTLAFAIFTSASRGFLDYYRMYPEAVWLRFPFGVEVHFANYFYYRGDFNPAIAIPVGDLSDNPAQVLLEHADEFEVRSHRGFGGGLRAQFVFALTDNIPLLTSPLFGNNRAQVAIEPFFSYEPHAPAFFARVGTLIALDEPLGFGFDRGKLAVIRGTVGGKF